MGIPVAIAIIVGLLCSFIQSIGLTIQRKSHLIDECAPPCQRKRPIRRPLWLLGFGIYITSNIFSTIFQLDALPIVILAPLGAVSLIFNALLARTVLGDTFGPASIVGTALVTVGAVLIAVFGVVQESEHGLDELLVLFRRPAFVAFFTIQGVATAGVLLTAHFAIWTMNRHLNKEGRIRLEDQETPPSSSPPSNYASPYSPPAIPFRPTSNLRRWSSPISLQTSTIPTHPSYTDYNPRSSSPSNDINNTDHDPKHVRFADTSPLSLSPDASPNSTLSDAQQRTRTLAGLAFAAASGTLSGMSLVLAKAAVELLVITIDHFRTGRGENQFNRAQSWLLIAGLGVGALLQLVYLNYSLTFASPALICPLAFCFFNLSSIFDGLVFYDQFYRLRPHQIALVSIGVLILLIGVWVVSTIQPGQGVDVGTWVEDELSETSSLLDHSLSQAHSYTPYTDEPDSVVSTQEDATYHSTHASILPHVDTALAQAEGYDRHRRSEIDSPTSPTDPVSPRTARRRGPRYGTLLPDLAPPGAPTGFSIGLGAASPGFVLRSGSLNTQGPSAGERRRGRSRSENAAGLTAIMEAHPLPVESDGPQVEGDAAERTLAGWDASKRGERQERDRRRWSEGWWSGLLKRDGVKLPPEE